MEKKLVSIIMPCFNDGAYMEEAVSSVRNQTYPNIELIIIDDGSDDDHTIALFHKLEKEGAILLHSDHLGPAGARNTGIASAKGSYILPLDADDRIDPRYVEKAAAILDENDNIGAVYCYADLFGEQKGPWELAVYSFDKMLVDNVVFVSAMFRRTDWERVGGFNLNMKDGLEDYDFWLSILELGLDICQIPEILFHYRVKPTSRTTRFISDPEVVKQTYRQIYKNHPALYDRYKDQYAMLLRDALIEQTFRSRKYAKVFGIVNNMRIQPVLKYLFHKIRI